MKVGCAQGFRVTTTRRAPFDVDTHAPQKETHNQHPHPKPGCLQTILDVKPRAEHTALALFSSRLASCAAINRQSEHPHLRSSSRRRHFSNTIRRCATARSHNLPRPRIRHPRWSGPQHGRGSNTCALLLLFTFITGQAHLSTRKRRFRVALTYRHAASGDAHRWAVCP